MQCTICSRRTCFSRPMATNARYGQRAAASMGSSASAGRSTAARETARFAGRWPCGMQSANTASRCVPYGKKRTLRFCAGPARHC